MKSSRVCSLQTSLIMKLAVLLCVGACATNTKKKGGDEPTHLAFRASFGSCNHEYAPQNYWQKILNTNPNVWIWLGDAIYADTRDLDVFRAKYRKQLTNPYYNAFAAQVRITGTWDDHDFGENDAGSDYPLRDKSRELFWDFMGVPASSVLRSQEGIYRSESWTVVGQKVKLIILDERTFRDPLEKDTDGSYKVSGGDMLGTDQWVWLENELKETSDVSVIIVASGTQVLSDKHPFEKWANFPKSRARLLTLLESTHAKAKIILSGDRHFGETAKLVYGDGPDDAIYEITSSGLTHSFKEARESNVYRVGDIWPETNFGLLDFLMRDQSLEVDAYVVDLESGKRVSGVDIPLSTPAATQNPFDVKENK